MRKLMRLTLSYDLAIFLRIIQGSHWGLKMSQNAKKKKVLILAIQAAKGGVGKSTTTINLACVLTAFGLRVGVVDFDEQKDSTDHLKLKVNEKAHPLSRLIVDDRVNIEDCVMRGLSIPTMILIPGDMNTREILNHKIKDDAQAELHAKRLRANLEKLFEEDDQNDGVDILLIDGSPAKDNIAKMINGVCTHMLYIVDPCQYATKSVSDMLISESYAFGKRINPEQELLGVVINKVDMRTTVAQMLLDDNRPKIGGVNRWKEYIPFRQELIDNSHFQDFAYINDPDSRLSESYVDIAKRLSKEMGFKLKPLKQIQKVDLKKKKSSEAA
ncbi:ParA family protein [Pseudomonas aeruginosa]